MNWKTTVAGILSVVVAVLDAAQAVLSGKPVDWNSVVAAIIAGIGLIMAADHNVVNKSQ